MWLKTITLALMIVASFLCGLARAQLPHRAPVRDDPRTFAREVRSWSELKQQNIVMQQRDFSCGAAALATLARYHLGDQVNELYFQKGLDKLLTKEEVKDRIENGLSLSDLRKVAVQTGYEAVVTRLSFEKLAEVRVPLLIGITERDYKHFVVYRGTNFRWVFLADPIRGHIRLTPQEFMNQWQKNLALAIAKPGKEVRLASPLSLDANDLIWGEVRDQLIRTQPQRNSIHQSLHN